MLYTVKLKERRRRRCTGAVEVVVGGSVIVCLKYNTAAQRRRAVKRLAAMALAMSMVAKSFNSSPEHPSPVVRISGEYEKFTASAGDSGEIYAEFGDGSVFEMSANGARWVWFESTGAQTLDSCGHKIPTQGKARVDVRFEVTV